MNKEALVDENNNIISKDKISLFKQIKEDFNTPKRLDPAYNSFLEVFFNYPGVIALIHHRVASRLYKRGFRLIARIIMGITQFLTHMDLHPAAFIGRRVFIDHGIGVVIGQTAQVGNDVTIYQGVSLGGVSLKRAKRHPTILNGVVIGSGSKILGDIVVGQNAKIGSNSVVIKNVPNNCTAVGIPARILTPKQKDKKIEELDSKITIKMPDVDKQMFEYILCKMKIFEQIIDKSTKEGGVIVLEDLCKEHGKYKKQQEELDIAYERFTKALKD